MVGSASASLGITAGAESPLLTEEVSISGMGLTLSNVRSKTGVFSRVETFRVFSRSSIFLSVRASVGMACLAGSAAALAAFCFSRAASMVCWTTELYRAFDGTVLRD